MLKTGKKLKASAKDTIIRLFMQTPPPNDHDLDLALRRYSIVLVHLAVVRQMTWTKTQFFLALNIGLLTLAGALAKTPFIGTGWLAGHATRIVAVAGETASVLWGVALYLNANEVNRCLTVCQELEHEAMGEDGVLTGAKTGRVLTTHGIMALLFFLIWLAVIRTLIR
jgi:hypothetical protein